MISPKSILATGLLLLATSTTTGLRAAEKPDLERITPVSATEQIPVQDFFRPKLLHDPTINISGTHIAAIISASEDHTSMMVYGLKDQSIQVLGTRGDSDIDTVTWLNENRLVFDITVWKRGYFILGAAEVGALHSAYPLIQNAGASLVSVPPKDRLHPLVRLAPNTENTGKYAEVATVNALISSGKMMDLSSPTPSKYIDDATEINVHHIMGHYPTLETPDGFNLGYIADKDGQLAFATTSINGQLSLYQLVNSKWEKCPFDLDEVSVLGSGDNPGEIVILGARQEGKPRALEVREAATGKLVDVLLQDKVYDCNAWLYRDPVSFNIVGAIYNRAGPCVVWLNESYRSLQKLVDGLFPGQVVRILGTDDAGKIALISSFSDRQPPIYSWVNLEKHTAGLIKNSSPWIDPKRMQPMNVIKYKTRDGRQLDAYLTMPAGATKANPPALVVLPPQLFGRTAWGYDPEVQFLASRGYAVLQPNYRGSASYSGLFPVEDEWDFRKMYEDVNEATKTVIASGLVDHNRVAIMGTSFGGYLALSGVAYEPSLYRCAVAISAVYDWGKLISDNKYNKFSSSYYTRLMHKLGDPTKNPEKWDAIAPIRHAENIRAAVFTSEGEYDTAVDRGAAKDLGSILKKNQIPTESISFLNESFGANHLRAKIELYTRVEAFLAKHLAPGTPTAATP